MPGPSPSVFDIPVGGLVSLPGGFGVPPEDVCAETLLKYLASSTRSTVIHKAGQPIWTVKFRREADKVAFELGAKELRAAYGVS